MGVLKARIYNFFCLLSICSILFSSSLWAITSGSIVICGETGRVLHEQNADAMTPPASLTKMMTLYLTFKALREGKLAFNQHLPVSKHASLAAPCKLGLKPGSTITVRDAIMGMVTKSANDASITIAEKLGGGSEPRFSALMTQEARRLGMSRTVFRNAHGLPEKQQSITTARDMATLARALYKDYPEYFKFFKEQTFAYKGQIHNNHNHLLGRIPGVDGIKTGFINASGFNLAASMVRDNHRIIAVVLGGENRHARDRKMVKLLELTHAKLIGKVTSPKEIGDLICTSGRSGVQATPIKTVVYPGQCRPAKFIQAKYASVDDLLDTVYEPAPQRRAIKKPKMKLVKHEVRKPGVKKISPKKVSKKVLKKASPKNKRKR